MTTTLAQSKRLKELGVHFAADKVWYFQNPNKPELTDTANLLWGTSYDTYAFALEASDLKRFIKSPYTVREEDHTRPLFPVKKITVISFEDGFTEIRGENETDALARALIHERKQTIIDELKLKSDEADGWNPLEVENNQEQSHQEQQ